jgi:hypothetical protein
MEQKDFVLAALLHNGYDGESEFENRKLKGRRSILWVGALLRWFRPTLYQKHISNIA